MRSTIIQRQVRNIINYGQSQERRDYRPQSQKIPDRAQSAKTASKVIRQSNEANEIDQRFRAINTGTFFQKPVKTLNKSYNSYIESPKDTPNVGRQLVFEKEKLYQEQFQLKRSVHNLNDENLKFRTKIQQLESSLLRYEKMIQEVDSLGPTKPQFIKFTNEAHFTNSLKKEIKAMKLYINTKEVEIQKIKRHLKNTKIQELEIEKKGFSDETIRLKYLLEQTIQASTIFMSDNNVSQDVQDKLLQQTQQIQALKLDKIEQDIIIARLQKQCLHYKTSQIDIECKLQKDIRKLRMEAIERQKENDLMKSKFNKPRLDDSMMKGLLKELDDLKTQLNDKNKQLEDNEYKVRATPNTESIRQTEHLQVPSFKDSKIIKIVDIHENQISDGFIQKQKNRPPTQEVVKQSTLAVKGNLEGSQVPQVYKRKSIQGGALRKMPPIQFDEVKWVGQTLKYRLRALKIDWRDIDDYLFSKQMIEDNQSNLAEIRLHIQKFPFDLSFQNSNIVARYMVESDTDNQLTDNSYQSNPIIKSVFRRVVGVYQVEPIQDGLIRIKLQDQLSKYKTAIFEAIKQFRSSTISKQQLEDSLLILGLELSELEVDYLIVQCILESDSVNKLNFQEMLKFVPTYDPKTIKTSDDRSNNNSPLLVDHKPIIGIKQLPDFTITLEQPKVYVEHKQNEIIPKNDKSKDSLKKQADNITEQYKFSEEAEDQDQYEPRYQVQSSQENNSERGDQDIIYEQEEVIQLSEQEDEEQYGLSYQDEADQQQISYQESQKNTNQMQEESQRQSDDEQKISYRVGKHSQQVFHQEESQTFSYGAGEYSERIPVQESGDSQMIMGQGISGESQGIINQRIPLQESRESQEQRIHQVSGESQKITNQDDEFLYFQSPVNGKVQEDQDEIDLDQEDQIQQSQMFSEQNKIIHQNSQELVDEEQQINKEMIMTEQDVNQDQKLDENSQNIEIMTEQYVNQDTELDENSQNIDQPLTLNQKLQSEGMNLIYFIQDMIDLIAEPTVGIMQDVVYQAFKLYQELSLIDVSASDQQQVCDYFNKKYFNELDIGNKGYIDYDDLMSYFMGIKRDTDSFDGLLKILATKLQAIKIQISDYLSRLQVYEETSLDQEFFYPIAKFIFNVPGRDVSDSLFKYMDRDSKGFILGADIIHDVQKVVNIEFPPKVDLTEQNVQKYHPKVGVMKQNVQKRPMKSNDDKILERLRFRKIVEEALKINSDDMKLLQEKQYKFSFTRIDWMIT